MKYWVHKLLILAMLFLFTCSVSAEEIIRITNGEWPPYLSENLPHNGFASHVVSEAFAEVGITVEYGFYPWKRSFANAKNGQDYRGTVWHGSVVWVYTDERSKDFLYSEPVIVDTEVLFHLKSNPLDWKTVDDLRNKIIGGTSHTVYPFFTEAEKRGVLKIERAGNYHTLFKKLLYRGIDAVPQVLQVGRYFMRARLSDKERSQITYSPTVIQERRYHLILSKQVDENTRLLRLFNEGLQRIRANGRYNQMYLALEKQQYDAPVKE